jgi:uncharacterized protein YneF (UPF0154 family)
MDAIIIGAIIGFTIVLRVMNDKMDLLDEKIDSLTE